jgi:rare lipoprotein A
MPRIEVEGMPCIQSQAGKRTRSAASWQRRARAAALASLVLLMTGCRHKRVQAYAPPPPPLPTRSTYTRRVQPNPTEADRVPITPPVGRPEFVETGMASWYGPSGRRAADGSAYDGMGMTAAHKTLPLGTVARVTNLSTNESVTVRITDRGPFSHGRILDLSENAAKQIGLYRMGVAEVRIEAFGGNAAPVEGKWCVQTGAFKSQQDALDLKAALARRYTGARVIEFASETGFWVRIDPVRHDRTEAAAIKEWIGTPFPEVVPYVVRLN